MPPRGFSGPGGCRPDGAILAGGAARRMGRPKTLVELGGRPMLQHVIERMAPQVERLVLSVERVASSYRTFGLPQVADPMPAHQGPLSGLLAALRYFDNEQRWLLLAPCDAPFLPPDLAERLQRCAAQAGAPAAVVVESDLWQPTFSIWHGSLRSLVERAVLELREGGLRRLLREVGAAACAWPNDARQLSPFFNINDSVALERAEQWLQRSARSHTPCSA